MKRLILLMIVFTACNGHTNSNAGKPDAGNYRQALILMFQKSNWQRGNLLRYKKETDIETVVDSNYRTSTQPKVGGGLTYVWTNKTGSSDYGVDWNGGSVFTVTEASPGGMEQNNAINYRVYTVDISNGAFEITRCRPAGC